MYITCLPDTCFHTSAAAITNFKSSGKEFFKKRKEKSEQTVMWMCWATSIIWSPWMSTFFSTEEDLSVPHSIIVEQSQCLVIVIYCHWSVKRQPWTSLREVKSHNPMLIFNTVYVIHAILTCPLSSILTLNWTVLCMCVYIRIPRDVSETKSFLHTLIWAMKEKKSVFESSEYAQITFTMDAGHKAWHLFIMSCLLTGIQVDLISPV